MGANLLDRPTEPRGELAHPNSTPLFPAHRHRGNFISVLSPIDLEVLVYQIFFELGLDREASSRGAILFADALNFLLVRLELSAVTCTRLLVSDPAVAAMFGVYCKTCHTSSKHRSPAQTPKEKISCERSLLLPIGN